MTVKQSLDRTALALLAGCHDKGEGLLWLAVRAYRPSLWGSHGGSGLRQLALRHSWSGERGRGRDRETKADRESQPETDGC